MNYTTNHSKNVLRKCCHCFTCDCHKMWNLSAACQRIPKICFEFIALDEIMVKKYSRMPLHSHPTVTGQGGGHFGQERGQHNRS